MEEITDEQFSAIVEHVAEQLSWEKSMEEGSRVAAPHIEQEGLPVDRMPNMIRLAQRVLDDGINTPSDLAVFLDEISDGRARRYSQAMWNAIGMVDPSLTGTHDWKQIYAALDAEASSTDAGT